MPAREGALRVLQAARDAGVKRVVMTSSLAAIGYGHPPTERPFSEEGWTDPTRSKLYIPPCCWRELHNYPVDELPQQCRNTPLRPGSCDRFCQRHVQISWQSPLLDVDSCSRIVRWVIQAVTSMRKMVSIEVGLVPLARSTVSVGVSVDA